MRVKIPGDRLDSPEMLAKDESIKSVHWAFINRDR